MFSDAPATKPNYSHISHNILTAHLILGLFSLLLTWPNTCENITPFMNSSDSVNDVSDSQEKLKCSISKINIYNIITLFFI